MIIPYGSFQNEIEVQIKQSTYRFVRVTPHRWRGGVFLLAHAETKFRAGSH
jgi:hypothetical protein